MIKAVRHTGLVVLNLERAMVFYGALGLKLWKRERESGAFIEKVVGISGAEIEWAKLISPDGALLELIQYHSCSDQKPFLKTPSNQIGCSHIAFTVNDIEATCSIIQDMGGLIVNKPEASGDGQVIVCYAYDIDGILIELVEETR